MALGLHFIEKETLAQVFSCEFWEIFKNTFFYRTPLVAASVLALNKLRKRKMLFRRKMKELLLTFALFMKKQDYYYCSGHVSQVPQNQKTRRQHRYWMINYEQTWF